jgi:hypothetical protein
MHILYEQDTSGAWSSRNGGIKLRLIKFTTIIAENVTQLPCAPKASDGDPCATDGRRTVVAIEIQILAAGGRKAPLHCRP